MMSLEPNSSIAKCVAIEKALGEACSLSNVLEHEIAKYGLFNATEAAIKRLEPTQKHQAEWQHNFSPGFYLRTIHMPAGTFLVSERHTTWHSYYITKGHVVWVDEHTGEVREVETDGNEQEHFVSITEPGARRMMYCHKDTIWTTVHPTHFTTLEEVLPTLFLPNTNPLLT